MVLYAARILIWCLYMPVRKGVGSYRSVDNPLDRNRALRELVQPIAKPHDGGDGGDGKRNLTTAAIAVYNKQVYCRLNVSCDTSR